MERRTFLRSAGCAAVAGLLTACKPLVQKQTAEVDDEDKVYQCLNEPSGKGLIYGRAAMLKHQRDHPNHLIKRVK